MLPSLSHCTASNALSPYGKCNKTQLSVIPS